MQSPVLSLCENHVSCYIHDSWEGTRAPMRPGDREKKGTTTAVEPVLLLEKEVVVETRWCWVEGSIMRGRQLRFRGRVLQTLEKAVESRGLMGGEVRGRGGGGSGLATRSKAGGETGSPQAYETTASDGGISACRSSSWWCSCCCWRSCSLSRRGPWPYSSFSSSGTASCSPRAGR